MNALPQLEIRTLTSERPVPVKQVPANLNAREGRVFFREVQKGLNVDRPRMVLDCSHLRELDSAGIHVLLRCLEEAMKRNGDIKLAGIQPVTAKILQLARVDRLFETFDNTSDAMKSFRRVPLTLFQYRGLDRSAAAQESEVQCL